MLRAYVQRLQTHPLSTNAASASIITIIGDALAQYLEQREQQRPASAVAWDPERTARMFCWGATWMGAPMSVYYRWLVARFGERVAPKLLVNQLGMAPLTNALFFSYQEALKPETALATWAERYTTRMANEFPAVTGYSMLCWIPAQYVNFSYVPLHLRPLYLNTGMVLWTAYLSIAGHRKYAVKYAKPRSAGPT